MLSIGTLVGVVAQGGHAVELNAGYAGEDTEVFSFETVAAALASLLLLGLGGGAAEGIPAAVKLALGVVVSAPGAADDASHAPPSAVSGCWYVGWRFEPVFSAF